MQSLLATEPVLQTLVVPAGEIMAANRQLEVTQIAAVSIVFDRSGPGEIYLDNVAVAAQ